MIRFLMILTVVMAPSVVSATPGANGGGRPSSKMVGANGHGIYKGDTNANTGINEEADA
jgi:hypothetical protein